MLRLGLILISSSITSLVLTARDTKCEQRKCSTRDRRNLFIVFHLQKGFCSEHMQLIFCRPKDISMPVNQNGLGSGDMKTTHVVCPLQGESLAILETRLHHVLTPQVHLWTKIHEPSMGHEGARYLARRVNVVPPHYL